MENKKIYRAVVDIDGVIATGGKEVYSKEAGWAYEKCVPIHEGVAMLRRFRRNGVEIKLHTARWESDREKTEKWLEKYDIPYDSLRMGKPSGDIYIDDRGYRFVPGVLGQMLNILRLMKEELK
jgi:uncharacterized HAD superfamily protein